MTWEAVPCNVVGISVNTHSQLELWYPQLLVGCLTGASIALPWQVGGLPCGFWPQVLTFWGL
jgi:hypothetical protein